MTLNLSEFSKNFRLDLRHDISVVTPHNLEECSQILKDNTDNYSFGSIMFPFKSRKPVLSSISGNDFLLVKRDSKYSFDPARAPHFYGKLTSDGENTKIEGYFSYKPVGKFGIYGSFFRICGLFWFIAYSISHYFKVSHESFVLVLTAFVLSFVVWYWFDKRMVETASEDVDYLVRFLEAAFPNGVRH